MELKEIVRILEVNKVAQHASAALLHCDWNLKVKSKH
jgi:hypothetical protein